ncbi:hypothetical protein PENTCL1PPCAC_25490 [Pristionchus entomophagus]|uniref:G protein-coupled receptor n=1 Tax=Pristionchus entomophagus TaxID=358040 RepID=A0AAV5U8W2_9BILA|nr:hypothetical protein PENTCL1PPCAC_25490 [Pristionchus entomophagus]
MTGALLNNLNDMAAFITSLFVVVHCRRKYMRIKYISKRTLNERYQTKEAYLVAKAMLPAYACNMTCKILCMGCNWVYITGYHKLHGGYGIFEAIYVFLNIIVCGVGSTFFLLGHEQLRARLLKIMGRNVPTAVVPFRAPGETLFVLFAVAMCAFAQIGQGASPAPLTAEQMAEMKAKIQAKLATLSADAQTAGNHILAVVEANEGNMEATKTAVDQILSTVSNSVKAELKSILPGSGHFGGHHKQTTPSA